MTGPCPLCGTGNLAIQFETVTEFDGSGRSVDLPNEHNFAVAGCRNPACGAQLRRNDRSLDGLANARLTTGGIEDRVVVEDELVRAAFIAAVEGFVVAGQ